MMKSIKHRIDKACTTNSNSDLKKQIALLSRQVQKLEKQVLKKDQQIFQMKNQIMPSKQVQAELIQLYRALRYYEGKAKEMENQIYKFRDLILKSPDEGVTAANLNILFQELLKQNEELAAQYEQSEYLRASSENQYNRIRAKYLQSKRQLSEYKRFEVSPIYQYYKNKQPSKFNRIINEIIGKNAPCSMQLKQKQIANKQLQQKIEQMEKQIELIHQEMRKLNQQLSRSKAENFILQNQIEGKDRQITQLFTDYMNAKKSLKKIQSHQNIAFNRNQQFYTPSFKLHRYGSMQNV